MITPADMFKFICCLIVAWVAIDQLVTVFKPKEKGGFHDAVEDKTFTREDD